MSSHALQRSLFRIADLARRDGRYKVDAYLFVHQTLAYLELQRGKRRRGAARYSGEESDEVDATAAGIDSGVRHFSPQQLCEAVRQYALELFGLMARTVLRSWGVCTTSDLGEVVFRLIEIGELAKSESDQRSDFDGVFDFDWAFRHDYQFTPMDALADDS